MIKNKKAKIFLKKTIFRGLSFLNGFIPKSDKKVLLYSSNRGIHHNLKSVKNYLLENGFSEKYKIYCGIEDLKYAENDGLKYIKRIRSIFVFLRSRHVFYSSGQIPIKPSKKQIVIHLFHGASHLKACGAMSHIKNGNEFFFTYYLAPSRAYIPVTIKEYLCKEDNVKLCGEAVTDVFYKRTQSYDLGPFAKIILWAPTFRQSDYYGYNDSSEEMIPMFNPSEYEKLNSVLRKYNFKLIIKLHPGQSLNEYSHLKLSNIVVFSDEEFNKSGFDLYVLLKQVDFLIADYSSIYLQFLLLDRPISFVIPDFEEYKHKRGFVFDNVKSLMPGPHITCKEELYRCFEDWHNGVDLYSKERKTVRDLIHLYQDGDNARRAVVFSDMSK